MGLDTSYDNIGFRGEDLNMEVYDI